jgi:hypothetical protein
MRLNCQIKFDKSEDIKKYLKLMNEFRIEYFNKPNVPKITESDFAKNKQYRIIPFMLLNGTTPLGIAEITCGNIFNKKRLDISTVYVIPEYRKQRLSETIYNNIESLAHSSDACFGIQIEQSSLLKNIDKFQKLGFVCYDTITEWTTDHCYNEKTYVLFRKNYLKRLKALKKENFYKELKTAQ